MAGKQSVRIRIGVLALQGNVSEHITAFKQACASLPIPYEVLPLRTADEIQGLSVIAIPGGESTTIARLVDKNGMREAMVRFSGSYFVTCAGMVLISTEVIGEDRYKPLGIIDISVNRNAFGRQKESFETDIMIQGLETPFHAVFIRAPAVVRTGPDVIPLATMEQGVVALQAGRHMAFSFHPEMSGDIRLHTLFLTSILS